MQKIIAIAIFLIMYVLMIVLPKRRAIVALVAATIMVALQILPLSKVLPSIDWNVLMMIFGTMVIVDYFIDPVRLVQTDIRQTGRERRDRHHIADDPHHQCK